MSERLIAGCLPPDCGERDRERGELVEAATRVERQNEEQNKLKQKSLNKKSKVEQKLGSVTL